MAVKPVVTVAVNTQQWQNFQNGFNQYIKNVTTTNNTWNITNKQIQNFNNSLNQSSKTTNILNNTFNTLGKGIHGIANDIERATRAFLKWTGIATIAGGILALGGMFGLDRIPGFGFGGLAMSAANMRNRARGIGATPGEISALSINYRRYMNDPEGMLSQIADMKADPTKQQMLLKLGIDPNQSAYEIEKQLPAAIGKQYRAWGPMAGLISHEMGFDQYFSQEEMRRMAAASPEELAESQRRLEKDRTALDIPAPDLLKWQNFLDTIDSAKSNIEATFIKALTPLAGPLEQFSGAFADIIKALGENPSVKQGILDLSTVLTGWSEKVKSEDFIKDIQDFIGDIASITHGMNSFLQLFSTDSPAAQFLNKLVGIDPNAKAPETFGPSWLGIPAGGFVERGLRALGQEFGIGNDVAHDQPGRLDFSQRTEKKFNLAPWELWNTYGLETNYGKDTSTSPKGAMGPFQMLKSTFDEYKDPGGDIQNFNDASIAAARYLAHLNTMFLTYAMYHPEKKLLGQVEELAHAGYNMGEGALLKDLDAHGSDWLKYAPEETQKYIARFEAMKAAEEKSATPSAVHANAGSATTHTMFSLNNMTGSDVQVTTQRLVAA